MKHIKLFEENKMEFGKFYWCIESPFNDFIHHKLYYLNALKNIGCSKKMSENLLDNFYNYTYDYLPKYLYVAVKSSSDRNKWYIKNDGFDYNTFDFKGIVKLAPEEVNDIELEVSMGKYNL